MVRRFGIPLRDAKLRIERHWSKTRASGPDELLFEETEEYWADAVYRATDACWARDRKRPGAGP